MNMAEKRARHERLLVLWNEEGLPADVIAQRLGFAHGTAVGALVSVLRAKGWPFKRRAQWRVRATTEG